MKRWTRFRTMLVGTLVIGWLAAEAAVGHAAEEAWKFLEGLRGRGYYDTALDYLEQISTSPRCPEDLKEVIDYEAGVTLLSGLRQAATLEAGELQLDEARDRLRKFIQAHPEHPLVARANSQLAHVLLGRGRIKASLASRPSKSQAEQKQLLAQARTLYQEAQKVFEEAEKALYEKAKAFQGVLLDPSKEAAKIEQRDQARSGLIQAKLDLALVACEIGKTYQPGSKQFKENLNKAAQQYHDLYADYGSLVGGLQARMLEGQAYKQLGEADKAIDIMKEMLTLPDDPEAFRILKNQSLILLLETYLLPDVRKYEDAVARVQVWQKNARGGEESSPEGLKIHYLGGLAAVEFAESLKQNDPKRKENRAAAKQHFEFVARFPGEFQREAQARLLGLAGEREREAPEPTNYLAARDRGDFAWGTMVVAMSQFQQPTTKQERIKAAKQRDAAQDEAIKYYQMAIGMKTPEVPIDELNQIRFRLSYLYFTAGQMYKSAVLGEFLARRYPGSAGARKGAEIAIKAYRTLFMEALRRSEDPTFETERMNDIAQYTIEIWPDTPEAEQAWMMLIDTAVDNRDLDRALEFLDKISRESPQRGEAELKTGQALWAAYVTAYNKEQDERPPQAELDRTVKQAQQTLEQGISRMRKVAGDLGGVDYTLVSSVLSLAQIYIGAGQSEKAVTWLDDPKIGPLTLVNANDPVIVGRDQFVEDTYKAALQAYVGTQQLDKAQTAMNALEKMVGGGGDAEANKRLTRIYIRLGRELQEQLKRLRNENKTEELEKVSQGFQTFLAKISNRQQGNTFSSLNWVAETLFGLGAGMDPGGKELPEEAKNYYTSAAATYVRILNQAKKDPQFAPAGADINVKVRLAACLRQLAEYENAMKLLVSILREHERRLDVQVEAAHTYQDWGQQRPGYYNYAIKGGQEQEGRNLVWGWGGIARRVAPFGKKFEDIFHEARYNLALSRAKLALSLSGPQRTEMLKMAELDITRVYRLYPAMGGPEWFDKYDKLLKDIQKLLKKKDDGLKGEAERTAQATRKTTGSSKPGSK